MTIFNAVKDDALGRSDATELAERIARGDVSLDEITQASIHRAQAAHELNAVACERFDEARNQAQWRLQPRDAARPFVGVPSFIKDNLDVADLPCAHGSQAVPRIHAKGDAPLVSQLRALGLNILGKTRLPEFGLTATTEFSAAEPARNPWHTDHSTGGSSGGSAALVAAGVVPIAHANDGGGSIRIPASSCGLVGLKPSRGRVLDNPMAKSLPINIVADGVVTRSVRDTAAFFAAMELQYCNPKLSRIGLVEGPAKQRLRIGYSCHLPDGDMAHPDCVAGVERVATLCAGQGHHVEEMAAPLTPQRADDFLLYWAMLAAALAWAGPLTVARGFDASKLEPLTWQLARHFRRNAHKLPGALWRQKRGLVSYGKLTQNYDVVLSPTLGSPPPPLGYLKPDLPFEEAMYKLRRHAAFTPADNVCGTPAISLPLAQSADGLPIGIHFSAKPGQERQLLELAFELEQLAPWPQFAGDGLL
ncbi:MAG: amidase [Oceanococcus sp.]